MLIFSIYNIMAKKIRLSESELVYLINKVITESDVYSLQDQILTYQGDNKNLLKMSNILLNGGTLSNSALETAKLELEKEETTKKIVPVKEKTFKDEVRGTWENNWRDKNYKLMDEITSKGEKTYKNIKNSDKKFLFSLGDYEFSTPNQNWIDENIKSLLLLKEKMSDEDLSKEISLIFDKKTYAQKFSSWIDFLIDRLKTNSDFFTSILKKETKEWTILPKIDTNYTNWAIWIDKLNNENKLGGGSKIDKVGEFFKQRPIRQVVNNQEDIEHIKKIQEEKDIKYRELSFAEYELFKDSKDNYVQSLGSISKTSDIGDLAEKDFIGYLKLSNNVSEYKIKPDNIISFSSPGNQVDMVFGIDFLILLVDKDNNERWVPVQVKSSQGSASKAKLLNYDIGGISVFRTTNPEMRKYSEWSYYDFSKGVEKSFDKDFLKIN